MRDVYKEFSGKFDSLNKEETLLSLGVLTTTFYAVQNVFQRSIGFFGLHGAKSFPITAGVGLLATSCSLLMSQLASNKIKQEFREQQKVKTFWPQLKLSKPKRSDRAIRKDYVQGLIVGLSVFVLLERGAFRTVFPSSVIAPGVFANFGNWYKNSIPATGDVATESQRNKVQRLGKLFGCHQCGSRHVFTKETFIADHMPPTKFANEMNAKWWRRLMHFEVGLYLLLLL